MSNGPRQGDWKVSPWQVTTAGEAKNIHGPKMIVPDSQANSMRLAAARPHGTCKHFRLDDGQSIIKSSNFLLGLVNGEFSDSKYLPEWLSKQDGYGLCYLIGSDTLIHALHPGTCTLAQANSWGKAAGIFSWQRGEGEIVACPCWEERQQQAGKGSRRR